MEDLVQKIQAKLQTTDRLFVAVAGPPAAGKSTLMTHLSEAFGKDMAVLAMDGFHLDDKILNAREIRHRKGAPFTFDAHGFLHMAKRVQAREPVYAPEFDRSLELSRAAAVEIKDQPLVIAEGNYLLLDENPWKALHEVWDFSVWLDAPLETIEERIIERWLAFGFDYETAMARAKDNDIPNARYTVENSVPADMIVSTG